jgi:Domain of unknown function (DUF3883)
MIEISSWSNREKAIILGLFLSKFDKDGFQILGFESFREAFNTLGFVLKIKPMSIKNYRDEFDPFFVNSRVGRKRPMRPNCKLIFDVFKDYEINGFSKYIHQIINFDDVLQDFGINSFPENIENQTFAKRLITGESAEEYFRQKYQEIEIFEGFELIDTTKTGCGFDFKLKKKEVFWGVEVKGLSTKSGNILMTEKEFRMAQILTDRYCLFVVKNFQESPYHEYFVDPINSNLNFVCTQKRIIQSSWNAQI